MSLLQLIKNDHPKITGKLLDACITKVSKQIDIDKNTIKRELWRGYGWFTTDYINDIFEVERKKFSNRPSWKSLDEEALLLLLTLFKPIAIKIGPNKAIRSIIPLIKKMNKGLSYEVIPSNFNTGDEVIHYQLYQIANLFYSSYSDMGDTHAMWIMDIIRNDESDVEFLSWVAPRNNKYIDEYKFVSGFSFKILKTVEEQRTHREMRPSRQREIIRKIIDYP